MSGFKQVVAALERRYDYHSARVMAQEAVGDAGLERQTSYEPKELKGIVQKLAALGSGMEAVWAALDMAPRGVKLPTAEPVEASPEVPADAPAEKSADAPAEIPPAAPARRKGKKASKK